MRNQLLRALQRLPAGVATAETSQAFRLFSSSVVGDGSLLLHGSKQQHGHKGFNMPQLGRLPFSFASQMHTLTKTEDQDNSIAKASANDALTSAAPKVPAALAALPIRSVRGSAAAQRALATAAAGVAPGEHVHEAHRPFSDYHPFHILPPSPWPALASYSTFLTMLGMAGWFHAIPHSGALMFTGVASTALTAISWWRDCIIESDMGMHTEVVKRNLVSGVWLFIVSEAALFFGLLWACVDLGMSPNVHIQMQWPPVGIEAVGWDKRALVMSAVLAASYYSANIAMVAKDPKTVMGALATTIGLGVMFLGDQYLEYSTLPFTITDSAYGSTFFLTTGFHGMHVFLGALWLAASMAMYPRYNKPGVGMKGAILYWHFVDIVWIAVYGIIYVAQL